MVVVRLAGALRATDFVVVDLRAAVFVAAVLRAVVLRAVVFFTTFFVAALRAGAFLAATFFVATFFAATLRAGAFLAAALRAGAFLAATFFVAVFLAAGLRAGAFFAAFAIGFSLSLFSVPELIRVVKQCGNSNDLLISNLIVDCRKLRKHAKVLRRVLKTDVCKTVFDFQLVVTVLFFR